MGALIEVWHLRLRIGDVVRLASGGRRRFLPGGSVSAEQARTVPAWIAYHSEHGRTCGTAPEETPCRPGVRRTPTVR